MSADDLKSSRDGCVYIRVISRLSRFSLFCDVVLFLLHADICDWVHESIHNDIFILEISEPSKLFSINRCGLPQVMDLHRCWCCSEQSDEIIQCANCFEQFYPGCVSDECEDGHLCRSCASSCLSCEMPIVASGSNHTWTCTYCGRQCCPDVTHKCSVLSS